MTRLNPLCGCGCGGRVRRRFHTWLFGHVPRVLRSLGGQKGRAAYAFKRRRLFFEEEFRRMSAEGRTLTKESILDAFAAVYTRAYGNGYRASDAKWAERKWRKKTAA